MPNPDIIHAAGGIVWKEEDGEFKIAVVYRDRHGPEWSLPKGKLQRGKKESWEAAAIRETTEELGLRTEIISYADAISYYAGSTPKIVTFWHMRIADETPLKRDPEVKEIRWLTPDQAVEKVSHDDIKKLLRKIKFPLTEPVRQIEAKTKVKRIYMALCKIFTGYSKYRRLRGDLDYYGEELNYAIAHNNPEKCWTSHARILYQQACRQLDDCQIDEAWKSFHASRRMLIFGMSQKEMNDEAKIMRQEAGKLNEWRRKAVFDLIGPPENPHNVIRDVELFKAASLRDEHFNNEYYKNRITRKTFRYLTLCLVITLLLITLFFYKVDIELTPSQNQIILSVIFFGLLGGITSSMFKIRAASKVTRIPEVVNSNFFTFMRIFVGAVSALIIYLALEAGINFTFLENSGVFNFPYFYFVISFIAGFTERLLLNAVTSIVGKE